MTDADINSGVYSQPVPAAGKDIAHLREPLCHLADAPVIHDIPTRLRHKRNKGLGLNDDHISAGGLRGVMLHGEGEVSHGGGKHDWNTASMECICITMLQQ